MERQKPSSLILSENLKRVLSERGLSARAAAEICGVAPSTFSQWMSGTAPTDLMPLHRFSKALGLSFEWLVTGHPPELPAPTLDQIFERISEPHLSGYFEIQVRRLRPRTESEK
jgi:transcriptional regulator with XRE-family HTH domain